MTNDAKYMGIAREVSRFGTCDRRKVGAVLYLPDDRDVPRFAFNDAPQGSPRCGHDLHADPASDPCLVRLGDRWSCIRVVHAETKLVALAARFGVRTEGATIYTTTHPCLACARLIVPAGIVTVVFDEGFHEDEAAAAVLRAAGVELRRLS